MPKSRPKTEPSTQFEQHVAPNAPTPDEVARMTKQIENMPTSYFNHARIAAGYLDVRIFFGEQTVSPTGQVSFTEKLCIVMAPEFAHMFLALLGSQLMGFEAIFGKFRAIPQPNAVQKFSEKQKQQPKQ